MDKGRGREEVRKTLMFLTNYTLQHFRMEEDLMDAQQYPEAQRHKKLHHDLVVRLAELMKAHMDHGPAALTGTTLDFLGGWLVEHIQGEDFRAITFVDFVEALAIRSLRADHRISLQKIREAIRNARDRYQVEHLFARRDHRTVLIGRDLHIFLKEDPENPVGLTGRDLGQKSFKVCLESYMEDLEYDDAGLARIYTALVHKNQKVILDPRIHFGEPVLAENGFTAQTLWQAAVAEGSIEQAANIYEVSVEAVEAAYRYFNRELGAAA